MERTRRLGGLACLGLPIVFCLSMFSLLQTTSVTAATLTKPSQRQIDHPLYGVTLESVDGIADIKSSLKSFSRRMTARVVFQWPYKPEAYFEAVSALYPVSYIMGEILDSSELQRSDVRISAAEYHDRIVRYLSKLGNQVDIWEIANEINSDDIYRFYRQSQINEMIRDAYRQVKKRGARAAITLYSCRSSAKRYQMIPWARANIPKEMRRGLDYVFVSYYENDSTCRFKRPDWDNIFRQLAEMFPNAKVGFGEVGTEDKDQATHNALAASLIRKYYKMHVNAPRYVGGYFWWDGRPDFVPCGKRLWKVLDDAIRNGRASGRCRAAAGRQ